MANYTKIVSVLKKICTSSNRDITKLVTKTKPNAELLINTESTVSKSAIMQHSRISKICDTVNISPKRMTLKAKLREGKLVSTTNEIKIPKVKLKAPRPGFDESLESYVNIIKNNKFELRNICSKYEQGLLNEEQFANEYAKFLANKMDMPYYPELKQIISNKVAGGMQNTTNTLYYNLSGMNRMSDLMSTINHEMHHFLQQKEIFSTISIEKFSKLKAKSDIMAILKDNPNYCKSQAEIFQKIENQAKGYIQEYRSAGWDKIIEKYPKNTNPNSPYYKRAEKLLNSELNYVDGETNISEYMSNLLEKEAYEIGAHTQIEIEYSVLNTISKKEKDIAIEMYDCLNSPTFRDVPGANEVLEAFNRNPYNIIEIVKEANSMGLHDPYSILQRIL